MDDYKVFQKEYTMKRTSLVSDPQGDLSFLNC